MGEELLGSKNIFVDRMLIKWRLCGINPVIFGKSEKK